MSSEGGRHFEAEKTAQTELRELLAELRVGLAPIRDRWQKRREPIARERQRLLVQIRKAQDETSMRVALDEAFDWIRRSPVDDLLDEMKAWW